MKNDTAGTDLKYRHI